MRPAILSCCLASLAAPASAQLFAVSDRTAPADIYEVDFFSLAPAATGVPSAGSAFDGRYHYAETSAGDGIMRIDSTGVDPTVMFSRGYVLDTANRNLTADGSGNIWEVDAGTDDLYVLAFDEVSGVVTRSFVADLGVVMGADGDIAWSADGDLYIATNAGGNFVWDADSPGSPATPRVPAAGDPIPFVPLTYNGLAFADDKMYGLVDDGFVSLVFEIDPATMAPVFTIDPVTGDVISDPILIQFPDGTLLNDLAGFVQGGDEPCDENQPRVVSDTADGIATQTLFAGQHIDVGTVTTEIVGPDLVVTYNTTGDWSIDELHLWVGVDLADMPQNRRGSPKIGHFPYTAENVGGVTTYSFNVPLDTLDVVCPADPDRQYYVAAHAVVSSPGGGSETAWADGDRFVERGMWGTFFTVGFECVCDGPPPVVNQCLTAFAYSTLLEVPATCFLDIDEDGDGVGDFDRWGWSLEIPQTDVDGFYEFPIYAQAEGCDISIAQQVGVLDVVYDINDDVQSDPMALVVVEYRMFPGYEIDEVHFYSGATQLPLDVTTGEQTVALDQFPVIVDNFTGNPDEDFTSIYAYQFTWTGGPVNIVAHAVVCGEFD